MEDGLSFLLRKRALLARPVPDELKRLEKIAIVDLFDPDELGASKIYINSLIRSALEEPKKPNIQTNCPRVVIIDGRFLFNEHEFINRFVEEKEKLEQVQIYRPLDDITMKMIIAENLRLNLACNLNCQLVVIIPNSKIMFPDLLKAINRLIFPSEIHINLLLVVESLSNKKLEIFQCIPHCEVIRCQFALSDDRLESSQDGPICPTSEEKLSILSSKHDTPFTRLIHLRE